MAKARRGGGLKSSALDRVPPEVQRRIIKQALYLYEHDRPAFDALAALVARLLRRT